jgi:hypothetical protein
MATDYKPLISKTTDTIIKLAAVVGAITVIAGGYTFYLNNLWRPIVKVVEVDFAKGIAKVQLENGTIVDIYGDAVFMIGGDWGIKFGGKVTDGKFEYDRLELTKKGMVVEYLKR